jgi:hypothetical protein
MSFQLTDHVLSADCGRLYQQRSYVCLVEQLYIVCVLNVAESSYQREYVCSSELLSVYWNGAGYLH